MAQVYLPAECFQHILGYCDDRLESNQKILLSKCLAIIKHMRLVVDCSHLDSTIIDIKNGYFTSNDGKGWLRIPSLNYRTFDSYGFTTLAENLNDLFTSNNYYCSSWYQERWIEEKCFTNNHES